MAEPTEDGEPGQAASAAAAPPPVREPDQQTDSYAIASLVLSIAVFGIGSVLAVIFGHLSLRRIRESGGTLGGQGLATAGLVIGYAGLALTVVAVIGIASALGGSGDLGGFGSDAPGMFDGGPSFETTITHLTP